MIVAGVMTGTSVDGIDIALLQFGSSDSDFELKFAKIYQFRSKDSKF